MTDFSISNPYIKKPQPTQQSGVNNVDTSSTEVKSNNEASNDSERAESKSVESQAMWDEMQNTQEGTPEVEAQKDKPNVIENSDTTSSTQSVQEKKSSDTIASDDAVVVNGKVETPSDDKLSETVSAEKSGASTTTNKREDGTVDKITVDSQSNTVVSDYAEDGQTITKVTDTNKEDGTVSTTNYEDGKPSTKDVHKGTVDAHYNIDENGNERLTSRAVDKGAYTETTEFNYNEDDTVTSSTVAGNRVTVKNIKNPVTKNNNINGTVTDETVTEPGKQTVKEFDDNGNVTHQVEKYGEDPQNPDKQNEISYNQDGSRTEVFTQPSKNYKQTDEYNADGFKTKQTAEVDGKTYEATYDGKGHGSLTMKAGESVDSFCQRTKVPKSEVMKLNKFPGGVPQAGQRIVVPDKYVKATDSANYDVSAESEKAKGDAAEIKQKEIVANSDQIYERKGTKGKYSSYEEYARELMQQEGISTDNQMLVDKYTKKISDLNGGKPILELDTIKTPMTEKLKTKTDANDKKNAEEKAKLDELNLAKSNFKEIQKANIEARIKFEEEMKNENFTHWTADGVSKLWNNRFINLTGNTAKQVREELDAYSRADDKMAAALEAGDMDGFKQIYKDTYHRDYDGKLSDDVYKINDRVTDYNDSQQTGGTVVEGTLKGAGAVVGGAGGAAVASVLVDGAKDLTTGVKDEKGKYSMGKVADNAKDIKEHAGEKVLEYGTDAALNAGAAWAGGKAGEYVGGKAWNAVTGKAKIGFGDGAYTGALKVYRQAGAVSKAGGYTADNVASDVISGAKDIYTGNWADVAKSSAGGLVANAGDSAIKNVGKGVGKLIK